MLNSQLEIKIKALNQEQIFETLRKQKVKVYALSRISKFETSFKVSVKNFNHTKDVLKKHNAEVLGVQKLGLAKLKEVLLARIFVVIAVLFCLGFYVAANFFVVQIKVMGTSVLSQNQIQTFLIEKGYFSSPSAKYSIESSKIELALVENFPQISMASVAVKGMSLVINIKEKQSISMEGQKKDIVSDVNGRIVSISVQSGKKLVNPNDIVKAGDVLVSAESLAAENGVAAKAQITIEAWVQENYVHYEESVEEVYTGKTLEVREIYAFGVPIFVSSSNLSFQSYKLSEVVTKPKNIVLPITIKTKTYQETKHQKVNIPYESVKEKIYKQCKTNALQKLGDSDIILKENFIERKESGAVNVSYILTFQKIIS